MTSVSRMVVQGIDTLIMLYLAVTSLDFSVMYGVI